MDGGCDPVNPIIMHTKISISEHAGWHLSHMEAQKLWGTAQNNSSSAYVHVCVCVEGWECDDGAEIDLG